MGKTTEKDGKKAGAKRDKETVEFVKSLSAEHKMLIVLKKQLYGGKWEPMYQDLKNRLTGQPYIFKLASRINEDIERIDQMRQFEKQKNIDLCDYIDSIE
ncbi:MAG: hypothetical protein A2Y10_08955 [Planctomycetes bacterium GWF2_41_51]|nr:MAG: hypothetical protein A2Y10_08955 [Planctomycetes bacterium GWF2_41_51]HBG26209.1 hypothetical protein [Phycisphaerales bacterium]